jgi:ureidoglycolate dehydrogenase (NAD+)
VTVPPGSASRYGSAALRAWAHALLAAAGLRDDAAGLVADTLVAADVRGVRSHGIVRLPVYVARLERGLVARDPRPTTVRRSGAVAVVDAHHAPGQVAGVYALDLAVELAREHGVGLCVVRRSSHYGAAAYYVQRAAREGMVALTVSNVEPDVVPFGGARAALGTNPLAFAAPVSGDDDDVVLDMATSHVAMGKVLAARATAAPLGHGWAVDADGRPTTDPHAARSVLPLGGAKGYGLAVMIELLAGALSGAGTGPGVRRMYDDWDEPQDVGHFFLVIDPGATVGRDAFGSAAGGIVASLRATPPAPGFDRVLVPGDIEAALERRHGAYGVDVPHHLVRDLEALSARLGVTPPPPEGAVGSGS